MAASNAAALAITEQEIPRLGIRAPPQPCPEAPCGLRVEEAPATPGLPQFLAWCCVHFVCQLGPSLPNSGYDRLCFEVAETIAGQGSRPFRPTPEKSLLRICDQEVAGSNPAAPTSRE